MKEESFPELGGHERFWDSSSVNWMSTCKRRIISDTFETKLEAKELQILWKHPAPLTEV